MTKLIIAVCLSFALGTFIGWVFAHNTVATECEKLKSFYVGKQVYQCEAKQ